jgi:hypothetical protein
VAATFAEQHEPQAHAEGESIEHRQPVEVLLVGQVDGYLVTLIVNGDDLNRSVHGIRFRIAK